MRTPGRFYLLALLLCLPAAQSSYAQQLSLAAMTPVRVTSLAADLTGQIDGSVVDEAGKPIDGVVISALGGTTAFAVSDKLGQYSLRQLPPGPYLVRAHMQGFLAARSSMVNVRPAARSASSFTLKREGASVGNTAAPRVVEAGMGAAPVTATAKPADNTTGRDESDTAWLLRHMKRSILRDTTTAVVIPETAAPSPASSPDNGFLGGSFEFLGHAVGSSAKAATSLFSDLSLGGQVNLLTTGAFDNPLQLLQLDRTSSVAFFSLGAPVGTRGEWTVRAAMNQSDLSAWMLQGNYVTRAPVTHKYQLGMSYALQRYEGGNTAALQALSDSRNVGSLTGFDEWQVSRYISVGYGAAYAHYDYLDSPSLFSPRFTATLTPSKDYRVHAVVSLQHTAPGAEEYLPPARAEYVPPQRTFSPLSRATGFNAQATEHYEVGAERMMNGVTIGIRGFRERTDNQLITVFGFRQPEAEASDLGHYFVGSTGNADLAGVGFTFTHAIVNNVRGSVDYSISRATWTEPPSAREFAILAKWIPSALRTTERLQDLTTSLQTEIPVSATRVVFLYKLNNGFVLDGANEKTPGLDGRFDLQVNQSLPFMNFSTSQWEMLVAVRSMFHDSLSTASAYDELLVVRPPKRIVGGLTVKF